MSSIGLTLAPIFGLVVLGYVLRRISLPGDGFWPMASRLGYWVLIPSLLFSKLSVADIRPELMAPFGMTLAGAFYLVGALVLLATYLMRMPTPVRGSVLQGAVRHNGFVALAVAEQLFGTVGLSTAALAMAMLALVTNLSIVPTLLLLNARAKGRSMIREVVQDILRNPFILSICAGLFANVLLSGPIPVVHEMTRLLGSVALPLMLLCVGAGLQFSGLRARLVPLGIGVVGRYVVFPVFVLLIPNGLAPQEMLILLIFAAVPTAPTSSALAWQTGGDVPLMNAIVTVQTGLAFVTLPLTLALGQRLLEG
jgi:malonate transporter and related proteins